MRKERKDKRQRGSTTFDQKTYTCAHQYNSKMLNGRGQLNEGIIASTKHTILIIPQLL